MSKVAIRSFARTWAAELSGKNICVNTLSPGPIDTSAFEKISKEMKKMFEFMNPIKRIGKLNEKASAVVFIASMDANLSRARKQQMTVVYHKFKRKIYNLGKRRLTEVNL